MGCYFIPGLQLLCVTPSYPRETGKQQVLMPACCSSPSASPRVLENQRLSLTKQLLLGADFQYPAWLCPLALVWPGPAGEVQGNKLSWGWPESLGKRSTDEPILLSPKQDKQQAPPATVAPDSAGLHGVKNKKSEGIPVTLSQTHTRDSYLINVGMPHFGQESEGRWRVRIVHREFNMSLNETREKTPQTLKYWQQTNFHQRGLSPSDAGHGACPVSRPVSYLHQTSREALALAFLERP